MKLIVSNLQVRERTIEDWAEMVRAELERTLAGIFQAGHCLSMAKAELKHGQWLEMLELAGVSRRAATRLMRIASNRVLVNPENKRLLPVDDLNSLEALARLEVHVLRDAIATNKINPAITRKEVTKLVGKLKKTKARPNGHNVPISKRRLKLFCAVAGELAKESSNLDDKGWADLRAAYLNIRAAFESSGKRIPRR